MTSIVNDEIVLPAGTYRISPAHSTVSFETRHFFGLGRVRGSFAVADGTVRITSPMTSSTVTARVPAASFASGLGMRDLQVRSPMFLNAGRYPELAYRSGGLVRTSAGWTIHGVLTAHGGTAPVDLTVTSAVAQGGRITIEATARVNRYELGVTAMKGVAARDLDVRLTIVAEAISAR